MPRGKSKEELAKQGAKSRFGQPGGADPRKATKNGPPKHSIRGSVKYLSGKSIAEINALGTENEPTVAQLIAAVTLNKALKGDMQAVNLAIENVDGKLPQENQFTGKDGKDLQAPVIYLPSNGRDGN
jgi:hypothetical protein